MARELQALVKDLPVVLEEVGKDAAKLKEQIRLYTAFTNFVCEWWVHTLYCLLCIYPLYNIISKAVCKLYKEYKPSKTKLQKQCLFYMTIKTTGNVTFTFCHMGSHVVICRSEPVLPLLTFVQNSGNTTVYEWRTGKVPTVVERPVVEDAPPDTVTEDTVSVTVSILSTHDGHITNMAKFKLTWLPNRFLWHFCSVAPGLMWQLSAFVTNLLFLNLKQIFLTTDFVFVNFVLKPFLDWLGWLWQRNRCFGC